LQQQQQQQQQLRKGGCLAVGITRLLLDKRSNNGGLLQLLFMLG